LPCLWPGRSLQPLVSAINCGHIQGGVLWKILFVERQNNLQIYHVKYIKFYHCIFVNCFDVLRNTVFKEYLPEDDHNWSPRHVGGYAVYTFAYRGQF
jgi:hypothetical protein